ncbi:fluoride efflux transporter FluC [Clostridium lundense]|uniref:fluoride efflux transporter FluC n=1 Tax=Clostridium lundense TaxID=319475 RepID=UPI000487E3CB|nr:CrcB family protein [Clostridium lundense]
MKEYIFIGIGGFLGAISRLLIKNIEMFNYSGDIPVNTLIINITGSFLLSFILTLALEGIKIDSNIKMGLCTGFLGSYTTFSTLCKETYNLFYKSYYFASIYVFFSIVLGLLMAYLGVALGRKLRVIK